MSTSTSVSAAPSVAPAAAPVASSRDVYPRTNWTIKLGLNSEPTTVQFTFHESATSAYDSPRYPVTRFGLSANADEVSCNGAMGAQAREITKSIVAAAAIPQGWEKRVRLSDSQLSANAASILTFA